MIEIVPFLTAILKILIGFRILIFTSNHHKQKLHYSVLAMCMVAFFFITAVSILVNGHLVTIPELISTFFILCVVFVAHGNVAEIFRFYGVKREH